MATPRQARGRLCASCAAVADASAAFCPRCGSPLRPSARRRAGFAAFALAGLAAAAAIAWPAVGDWRARAGCEPQGWIDWHVAMQRSCLTPEYVCRNMTSSKLLEDPEVADELRRALEAGDTAAMGALESLVDGMRAEYGCAGGTRGPARNGRRLPPGHPPLGPGDATPTFDGPGGVDI
jgi:hypothetical protein